MWTREELKEIRLRAELEAKVNGNNELWRKSCLDLASAADRLDAITSRVESGFETVCESSVNVDPSFHYYARR